MAGHHAVGALAPGNFTPSIIHVHPGQNILAVIEDFKGDDDRGISFLSATGWVDKVVLLSVAGHYSMKLYDDYDIASFTGYHLPAALPIDQEEGITVSVTNRNGRLFGGRVSEQLRARSHVTVFALWWDI